MTFCLKPMKSDKLSPEEQKQVDDMINAFWDGLEEEAAKLEVTVDYYVEEFLV